MDFMSKILLACDNFKDVKMITVHVTYPVYLKLAESAKCIMHE